MSPPDSLETSLLFGRTHDPKVDLLADLDLFEGLATRDLARLAELGDLVDVEPGRELTRQGEFGAEFFVIVDGTVEVTVDDEHLAALGPGDFFGELALVDRTRRSATVTARTPMRLLVLHTRAFATLLDEQPRVGARILTAMTRRLRKLAEIAPAA